MIRYFLLFVVAILLGCEKPVYQSSSTLKVEPATSSEQAVPPLIPLYVRG